jgi:PRTRC genetic system protein C
MTVTPAIRIFSYQGITLPDLDCRLSPEEVKAAYSTQYPELATAAINGPEAVGDKLRYEFVRAIGAKG